MACRVRLEIGPELRPFPQRGVEDAGVRPGDQNAGRVPLPVPLDLSAGRFRGVPRVPDRPKRRPVQHRPVVEVQDEDRRVRRDGVDLVERRHPPLAELKFSPTSDNAHPLRRGRAAGLVFEHAQRVGQAGHAVPAEFQVVVEPAPDQVQVGVVEAGHGSTAAQIDHSCLGASILKDLRVVSDGGEAAAHYRRRLCFRPFWVEGREPAVVQNEFRRIHWTPPYRQSVSIPTPHLRRNSSMVTCERHWAPVPRTQGVLSPGRREPSCRRTPRPRRRRRSGSSRCP